jgi:hypothetical protein
VLVYTKEEFLTDRERVIQEIVNKAIPYINGRLKNEVKTSNAISIYIKELKLDPNLNYKIVETVVSRIRKAYSDVNWKVELYLDIKNNPLELVFS